MSNKDNNNSFLSRLEKRAFFYDEEEKAIGPIAFEKTHNKRYNHRISSSFIDDKAHVTSKRQCIREESRANVNLKRFAREIGDYNEIMPNKRGDSITRRKAINTLNSYVKDSQCRRSKRTKKSQRRVDSSSLYSFYSSSSSSDNEDNNDEDNNKDISFQGDNDVDEEDIDDDKEDDYKVDEVDNVGDDVLDNVDDDDVEYDNNDGDDDEEEEEEDVINDEEDVCEDSESEDDFIISSQRCKTERKQIILSDSSEDGSDIEFEGSCIAQSSSSQGNGVSLISQHLHEHPYSQPINQNVLYQSAFQQQNVPVSNHMIYHHYHHHHHHHQQQQMPPMMHQSPADLKWYENFHLLQHYKHRHHQLTQDVIGFKLHDWLSQQRRLKREGRLPRWKTELFNSIGM